MHAYEDKRYHLAFEEFTSLAEIGEKHAQFNLGIMYFKGEHVERNLNRAYAWTRLATEASDADAQEKNVYKIISSKVKETQIAEAEYLSLAASYSNKVLAMRLYPLNQLIHLHCQLHPLQDQLHLLRQLSLPWLQSEIKQDLKGRKEELYWRRYLLFDSSW